MEGSIKLVFSLFDQLAQIVAHWAWSPGLPVCRPAHPMKTPEAKPAQSDHYRIRFKFWTKRKILVNLEKKVPRRFIWTLFWIFRTKHAADFGDVTQPFSQKRWLSQLGSLATDVAGKIRFQVESVLTSVKLVILILPRLNTHSDGLKKLFWSLN